MMLSFAIASNSHNQSLMFLQKPNLFNVAITRAKKMVVIVGTREQVKYMTENDRHQLRFTGLCGMIDSEAD